MEFELFNRSIVQRGRKIPMAGSTEGGGEPPLIWTCPCTNHCFESGLKAGLYVYRYSCLLAKGNVGAAVPLGDAPEAFQLSLGGRGLSSLFSLASKCSDGKNNVEFQLKCF